MPMLDTYRFFNGTCAEAMRFYHRTLGGELQKIITYGDSPEPEQCPAGAKDLVMHACLVLDGRMKPEDATNMKNLFASIAREPS